MGTCLRQPKKENHYRKSLDMAQLTTDQLELIQSAIRARQRQSDFTADEVEYLLEDNPHFSDLSRADFATIAAQGYRRDSQVMFAAQCLQRDRWAAESKVMDDAAAAAEAERVSNLTDWEHAQEVVNDLLKSRQLH